MFAPCSPSQFKLTLAVGAALLAGCSSLKDDSALDDVRSVVADRTGNDIHVPNTQVEQNDVDAYAATLLAKPLTAPSATQVALLKSRRLRATLEDLNLSQADLLQASLPSNISLASSVRWPNSGGGTNIEMELAGDILNWLMLPLRRKLAVKEYEAAKRRISHEVLDVLFEVKEAFYEVQAQQQFLHRLQVTAEVNGVTSDIAQRLRKAGNISALELLQEQTNFQQATLEVRRTQGSLAAAREKLSRLMGLSSSENARWHPVENFPAMPHSEPAASHAESLAVTQRQDLAAERETLAALKMGYSLTRKMRYLPALNLGGNTERETDGSRLSGPTLDVELPLFNWGQGRVRRSAAEWAKAQASYEALELEVRSDVRTALVNLQAARNVHAQIASNVLPQRQRILRETLLQYNAMQISNFVLLRAKEDELKAQHDLIEAQRDYWIARAHLERAVGGTLNPRNPGKTSVSVNHDT